jgi:hypothetical protein
MKAYRTFNNLNNIRLFMVDIYKDIDEKASLKDNEVILYRLKLSILKEVASILKNDNQNKINELEKTQRKDEKKEREKKKREKINKGEFVVLSSDEQ